jgi:hypothetical protein
MGSMSGPFPRLFYEAFPIIDSRCKQDYCLAVSLCELMNRICRIYVIVDFAKSESMYIRILKSNEMTTELSRGGISRSSISRLN